VHDTLSKVENLGLLRINNGGMNTFVHSLPEILLRLEIFNSDSEYASDIVDLQVGVRKGISLTPSTGFDFGETDIVVIEVSTLKTIFSNEHPLQFNEVNRLLCKPHGDFGTELRTNIDRAFQNKDDSLTLPMLPFPDSMSESYRKIITGLCPKLMRENDVINYLDKICNYAKKPIMFVNHIDVEGKNSMKITSRHKLCQIIKTYCKTNKISLFEPSKLFSSYTKTELLAKNGEDLAHYAQDALEIIGLAQHQQIEQIFETLN